MNAGIVHGVSPRNVPVYHASKLKVIDHRERIAEVVLIGVICGLGVLGASLVGSDTQVKEIFSIQKTARFTDMKALVFLVIANGIVVGYSFLQGVRCSVSVVRGSVLFNKPLAWAIFSADQMSLQSFRLQFIDEEVGGVGRDAQNFRVMDIQKT